MALHRTFLQTHAPDLYQLNYGHTLADYSEQTLLTQTMACARRGHDEALFWRGRALERFGARAATRLWDLLEAEDCARETVRALRFFYTQMTHRERPIYYLYHALLLRVFSTQLEATPTQVTALRAPVDVEALYATHRAEPAMELDEFVHDLHTGERSAHGRTSFALEGAQVVGESTRFMVPRYRALYKGFKAVLDAHLAGGRR